MSAEVPVLHPRTTLAPKATCSACGHTPRRMPRDWHLLAGVFLGGLLASGGMLLTQLFMGADRTDEPQRSVVTVASIAPIPAPPLPAPLLPLPAADLRPAPQETVPYSMDLVPIGEPAGAYAYRDPFAGPRPELSQQIRDCQGSLECYLRVIPDPPPNARLASLRIESFRGLGLRAQAQTDMRRFIDAWPTHPRAAAYRQMLMLEEESSGVSE